MPKKLISTMVRLPASSDETTQTLIHLLTQMNNLGLPKTVTDPGRYIIYYQRKGLAAHSVYALNRGEETRFFSKCGTGPLLEIGDIQVVEGKFYGEAGLVLHNPEGALTIFPRDLDPVSNVLSDLFQND